MLHDIFPMEIINMIYLNLPFHDVISVISTCHASRSLWEDKAFWRRYLRHHYFVDTSVYYQRGHRRKAHPRDAAKIFHQVLNLLWKHELYTTQCFFQRALRLVDLVKLQEHAEYIYKDEPRLLTVFDLIPNCYCPILEDNVPELVSEIAALQVTSGNESNQVTYNNLYYLPDPVRLYCAKVIDYVKTPTLYTTPSGLISVPFDAYREFIAFRFAKIKDENEGYGRFLRSFLMKARKSAWSQYMFSE